MIKNTLTRARRYYEKHGIKSLLRESASHFRRELTRLPPQYYTYSFIWRTKHGFGTSIMDYDWDHIIILDACRLDAFQRQYTQETIDVRVSLGSNTTEFLRRTFAEGNLYDTVYVSSNPKGIKLERNYREEAVFHDLQWIRDCDAETGAVLPETVANAALEAAEKYPNKQLIIHVNKPHTPWLGPTAEDLREKHGITGFEEARELINSGEITVERLEKMYSETLEATLPVINDLVNDLNGRIVITADHGELLYEQILPRGRYWTSHPKRLRCSPLCRVPWVIIENGDRPNIFSDPPVTRKYEQQNIEKDIEKRLTALGYK